MDNKIKHRILGIFVIIGLVIILLPFFQHAKNLTNEVAVVNKAPPFPNQSVQLSTTQYSALTNSIAEQQIKSLSGEKKLAKLDKMVWVIQMGSFKNKANALRLVNQLRAKGYPAFLHQASGDKTRVYVGPENKQTAAYALASRLEEELHLHGIVISYKPLIL